MQYFHYDNYIDRAHARSIRACNMLLTVRMCYVRVSSRVSSRVRFCARSTTYYTHTVLFITCFVQKRRRRYAKFHLQALQLLFQGRSESGPSIFQRNAQKALMYSPEKRLRVFANLAFFSLRVNVLCCLLVIRIFLWKVWISACVHLLIHIAKLILVIFIVQFKKTYGCA